MRCSIAIKPEARGQIYWTMVSIDTLVSIGGTSPSSLGRLAADVIHAGVIFREPIRTSNCTLRIERCILVLGSAAEKKTIENELSRVVNAVGNSKPDRKLDRRIVDRGLDPTNHKLIHRKRRGENNAIRYSRKREFRQH